MIVVDANVLLLYLQQGELALKVRHADSEWRMPVLWRFEAASGALMMRRAGRMDAADALAMLKKGQSLFQACEEDVSSDEACKAAEAYGLTAYDGSYVALAERLHCKLLTLDKEILEKAARIAFSPEMFLGFPS